MLINLKSCFRDRILREMFDSAVSSMEKIFTICYIFEDFFQNELLCKTGINVF